MFVDPTQFVQEMIGRIDGPMKFRLLLQPAVAVFFALRDGRRDARGGAKPFAWALFTAPGDRRALVKDGWKGIGKVFVVAVLLDLVYQYLAIHGFRPLQAALTAALVALIPYLLVRGLANRALRSHQGGPAKP